MNNKSLQYLNLSVYNLYEDNLILIADSLEYVTSLISTDVSYNYISRKAAQSLAVALAKSEALEHLDLCACFVDNVGLTIFNAIKQHSTITHLNVKLKIITNELAKLIAFLKRALNIWTLANVIYKNLALSNY